MEETSNKTEHDLSEEETDDRIMESLLRAKNYFRQTKVLRKLIEGIIENAVIQAHNILDIGLWHGNIERINYDPALFEGTDPLYKLSKIGNPFNLTAKIFSVNLGLKLLVEFLKRWNLPRKFIKYIIFDEKFEDKYCTRYKYRVIFGMPTLIQPMPLETEIGFFTFVILKWKPDDFPVDFYYRLEGNYFVHRHGGMVDFCIEWIENFLLKKVQMKQKIIAYLQKSEKKETETNIDING
ncbi:uncharacterized protein LOC111632494 [Centruroides sculpturatus]|uniref:uncharacterized protein LOC111632494 n=1 Tax=Centruroides sculpturatus TaxID=218467 RepID=UPI000C6E7441|nr:uncharacterized protein LOC111632494 [Centruroides sculpturatus]